MLHIVFVRHGESIRNFLTDVARAGDRAALADHLRDFPQEPIWPLTELGVEQARHAGEFVRQHVGVETGPRFASPFVRARQTAELLSPGTDWHIDERLRERLWGDYPTGTYTVEQYLEDLHHCAEWSWKTSFPNSESIADLELEAASFMLDMPHEGSVLAVTHGGTLGAIQRVIERTPPHRALGNCGVLEYQVERTETGYQGRARFACPAFGDTEMDAWVEFG